MIQLTFNSVYFFVGDSMGLISSNFLSLHRIPDFLTINIFYRFKYLYIIVSFVLISGIAACTRSSVEEKVIGTAVIDLTSKEQTFSMAEADDVSSSTAPLNKVSDTINNGTHFCGTEDVFTTRELLKDTAFAHGIKPTLDPELDACQDRWEANFPDISQSEWSFIEVSQLTRFCDRYRNPVLTSNTINYSNLATNYDPPAFVKKAVVMPSKKRVRFTFDSGKEWRDGCALTKPDALSGEDPPHLATRVQHHLMITQIITDPSSPNNLLTLDQYNKLTFDVSLTLQKTDRLNSSEHMVYRGGRNNCPIDDWGAAGNHAMLKIGIVIASLSHFGDSNYRMYVIVPVWQTYNGVTYKKIGPAGADTSEGTGDPQGAHMYFTGMMEGKYKPLTVGETTRYSIDVQEVVAEAIGGWNQNLTEANASTPNDDWKAKYRSVDDYFVRQINIGWEIWGGFDTDLIIENPSLKGQVYSKHACRNFYRYWNPTAKDHYYTTDYLPEGFLGWQYEGVAAKIPTINMPGTKKLWRYWNPTGHDHFYTTQLKPFGIDGWKFERQAGSVFEDDPGPGYDLFERYWCRNNIDHLYQLTSSDFPLDSCYNREAPVGYLKNH